MDARLDDLIGGRPDVPSGGGRLVGACSVAALAKNARVSWLESGGVGLLKMNDFFLLYSSHSESP